MTISHDEPTPPLKWAGGKRWLVPRLRPLWQAYRDHRLVEPFCGGLAVALGLRPRRALLNDINPHLINFYRHLQAGLHCDPPFDDADNDRARYGLHRDRFNHLIESGAADSADAACLFYYLNRTGYNGLCRFNQSGRFNVPFGQYKRIGYRADFTQYQETMRGWELTSDPFDQVQCDPTDFIYADPPYDVEFTSYSKQGFSFADQERLAAWLAQHPGPVIASNQATERIVELYEASGFAITLIDAPRRISANGDRKPAKEILAFRNIAEEG